jgi:hypothetical protein
VVRPRSGLVALPPGQASQNTGVVAGLPAAAVAAAVAAVARWQHGKLYFIELHSSDGTRSTICTFLLLLLLSGANMGDFTIFLAAATGPSGVVYAFEPQARMFQLVCTNMIVK